MEFYDLGFSLVRNLLIIVIPKPASAGEECFVGGTADSSHGTAALRNDNLEKNSYCTTALEPPSLAAFHGGL